MGPLAKRFIKTCCKPLLALFRPFMRRVDAYMNSRIGQLSAQIEIWNTQQRQTVHDFESLGDSLVREMARLQLQLSLLEENLYEAIREREQAMAVDAGGFSSSSLPPSQAA